MTAPNAESARMTKRDWGVINQALAYLEAADVEEEFGMSAGTAAAHYRQLRETRRKVAAQIDSSGPGR